MTIDIISLQASTITELRKQVAAAEQQAKEWYAKHQGVGSLFNALQTSHSQLQSDYRRLSQAHQEMLLAHGSLLREHRAVTAPLQPLTTNTLGLRSSASALASGDCGIEFTDEMECNRDGCPTSPPHRHITPTHPPKSPGRGVPPCPVRINDIQAPRTASTISDALTHARFQASLDDDFGDSDVNPTRENPNHFKNSRTTPSNGLPPSLDINQAPPASNTREKGGAQGNPTKKPMDVNNIVGGPNEAELATARRAYQDVLEQKAADIYNQAFDPNKTLQQLQDSARIATKFADASGEAGPTVVDWHEEGLNEAAETGIAEALDKIHAELRQEIDIVSDCRFQAQDGSDETRNSPDKQTEDR